MHPAIPQMRSDFLRKVGSAVGRRAKALKHKTMAFECLCDQDAGHERFSVLLEIHTRARFRINVWSDAALWLGIHVPGSSGWSFAYQGRGRLQTSDTEKFVSTVEASILAIGTESHGVLEQRILAHWDFANLQSA